MNEIFGIPTTTIMFVMVVLFAVSVSVVVFIALRYPTLFRLGLRNVPRRPAQTILIVLGLMLSTLLIAAAFTTGDTLDHSIRVEVLDALGEVDERVVLSTGEETNLSTGSGAVMPEEVVDRLRSEVGEHPDISGLLGILVETTPVVHPGTNLSEPALRLTGLEPEHLQAFGGLTDVDGEPIDLSSLAREGIVLGTTPAEELDARPGDTVVVFVRNEPHEYQVAAIAKDSLLTGYTSPGSAGGFAMPLDAAQELLGYQDQITYVAVTNRGGVSDGVAHTDRVILALNDALDGTPYAADAYKQNNIESAEQAGNQFLSLFLMFGLFSIAVGILLIFLIFTMLAAERKSEMGMARAVGMRRRQLIEVFLTEGMVYDLVAALVGALLGIGVALIMVQFLSRMFAEFITIEPSVSWRSLIIAYTLGSVVTFVTVLLSSWRISRLNIVRAIRNIPEPSYRRASRRWLIFGIVGTVVGALMLWAGSTTGQAFPFSLGISLLPLSLAAILRRFGVPARLVYSLAAALVLLYWLLPPDVSDDLFGEQEAGIELFFVSGIMLVASATVMIIWNAGLVTRVVAALGQLTGRWLPVVRTAIAYPLANRGRTGMTIAMFSLVVFSLVMIAAINSNLLALLTGDNAGGSWDVQAVQAPTNPIDDIQLTLEEQGINGDLVAASGRVSVVSLSRAQVRNAGDENWGNYPLNGVAPDFVEESTIPLQTRAVGYESDEAVWQAIEQNPDLAVIDSFALPTSGINVGNIPFQLEGVTQTDETMEPASIEIRDPATGMTRTVDVIGVIDSGVYLFFGLYMQEGGVLDQFGTPDQITFYLRLQPGMDAEAAADEIEAGLITYGIQTDSVEHLIDQQIGQSRSFTQLFQGFMGLGLIVGIAALGVVAFRSVVERRQEIGILRAIGYRQSMVAATFLLESLIVTLLGVGTGALLGTILAYNLMTSDYFLGGTSGVDFIMPWGTILIFLIISVIAALLMAYIPAHRAARVPAAEALRYE